MVGIHGGYVASIAAEAILMHAGQDGRSLRSVNVQFVRPPAPGEIAIDVNMVSAGRSMSFVRADVRQDERPVLIASAILGHSRDGLAFDELSLPAHAGRPVPEDAQRFAGSGPGQHLAQIELRLEPGLVLFGGHEAARVAGWMRPLDPGEPVSVSWLVCAADFMPPSMVFRTNQPVKAASLDLSIQLLCADPSAEVGPGGYVYGEMRSSVSAEGFYVEDGSFWSESGHPLALSRQLRLAGT